MCENFAVTFPLIKCKDLRFRPIGLYAPEEDWMKATLIVRGFLAFQFAVSVFMGKCIRAGRGPSVRPARGEHGSDRASQNVDIEPQRPVADVIAI